jgi:hypothetical protein
VSTTTEGVQMMQMMQMMFSGPATPFLPTRATNTLGTHIITCIICIIKESPAKWALLAQMMAVSDHLHSICTICVFAKSKPAVAFNNQSLLLRIQHQWSSSTVELTIIPREGWV